MNYKHGGVAATPYALKLAAQAGIDISTVMPSGRHGEVRAADVETAIARTKKATPLAKRMAEDMGVDIKSVTGTGYGGKIRSIDIMNVAAAAAGQRDKLEKAISEIDEVLKRYKMTGLRKVIAKRMLQSHTEIPVVTQNMEVDVTDLFKLRADINTDVDKADRISVNDLILKATAVTVRELERFRTQIEGDEYVVHNNVHIGMAVGMDEGLIVPVIKDADKKSLFEISKEAKELAKKARDNKLTPNDYGMGVMTVSNMGMYGVHSFTPIINQPEAAILGVCAPIDRLILDNGTIAQRKIMMLSLTFDHRIINGTEAAEFELRMKYLLEHPAKLLY